MTNLTIWRSTQMSSGPRLAITASITALALAGCGGSARVLGTSPTTATKLGTLAGTLGIYGGAETTHSCGCFKAGGRLRLTSPGGTSVYIRVSAGKFSASVVPGNYRVSAAATYVVVKGGKHSPVDWSMGSCQMFTSTGTRPPTYIRLRPGTTTRIKVGCFGA